MKNYANDKYVLENRLYLQKTLN